MDIEKTHKWFAIFIVVSILGVAVRYWNAKQSHKTEIMIDHFKSVGLINEPDYKQIMKSFISIANSSDSDSEKGVNYKVLWRLKEKINNYSKKDRKAVVTFATKLVVTINTLRGLQTKEIVKSLLSKDDSYKVKPEAGLTRYRTFLKDSPIIFPRGSIDKIVSMAKLRVIDLIREIKQKYADNNKRAVIASRLSSFRQSSAKRLTTALEYIIDTPGATNVSASHKSSSSGIK